MGCPENLKKWNDAGGLRQLPRHPRLCQANLKSKKDGYCWKWAVKGSKYCKFHGGHARIKGASKSRISRLPPTYGKYLNSTLHKALEQQLGVKPSEQLQLLEELALMRDFAGQSVALYGAARESTEQNETKRMNNIMATGGFMAEILKQVSTMAESAARVNKSGEQYSIHDLQYVVYQLIHIMYRVCGNANEHLAIEFEKRVKDELVMPRQPEAVAHEPHHDVIEMDNTIPAEPETIDVNPQPK